MFTDNFIVIFSGYNQRAVIAFLRTLIKNNVKNFLILAKSDADIIFKTDYGKYVYAIRNNRELDIDEIVGLVEEAKNKLNFKNFIIAPTTEALNRFVLYWWERFENIGGINVLVEKQLYEMISDKKSFSEKCASCNILIPKLIKLEKEYSGPFVAKPKTYYDEAGKVNSPVIVKTKRDFDFFMKEYNIDSFFFQEYLAGRSVYLLYYFTKEGEVYSCSQENYMQQPQGKSILVAKPSCYHLEKISEKFVNLLLEEKYYGFIMIEIRVHENKEYMIEANPRFWGPSQLFVDMKYNLFEAFLKEYGFIEKSVCVDAINYNAVYYWHGGTLIKGRDNAPIFYSSYENEYNNQKENLMERDIYNRIDTLNLFLDND